jgi:hypothetical protein
MTESTQFIIGSNVACGDGVCGHLRRIVVDPVAHSITHLVVEPGDRRGTSHLVPIELLTSTGKQIRLRRTRSEYDALETADDTQLLPGPSGEWRECKPHIRRARPDVCLSRGDRVANARAQLR